MPSTAPVPSVLKAYLYRSLGVQEGEIEKMVLMQCNIFLIICASLIVKPIANGLFLAKFGVEQLPTAFILVAAFAGLVSFAYTRVLRKFSVVRIFRLTFTVSILSLVGFGLALRLNVFEGVILYLLYIWIAIFALVAASQFWIIANFVFSNREAKRLFGLLGAGGIAGAIFGGYLTSILANFLSSEYLLFLCALLLMACIPITEAVWSRYVVSVRSKYEQTKPTEIVAAHPFRLILRSRHLTFIAAIAFVGVLVAKLVDYQFAGLAVQAIEDPDELTAFFGFWFSTFNVVSLLIQLLVTRRVVGTFGVGTSLLFLPGFVLAAGVLMLIFPELLLAAVFLKMTDASLKQSVNKAAMELLILPIPTQVKNQTKTFIDVFVDSIATGVSGLLLIFVIQGLDLPAWFVTILILLFGVVWIALAQRGRREYVKTFSRRIEEAIGLSGKKDAPVVDFARTSVLDGMRKVLRSGSESQIKYVLQKLREYREGRLYKDVVSLLTHRNQEVVADALRYLCVFRRSPLSIRDQVEPLMYAESQDVKIEAFDFLLRLDYEARDEVIGRYVNDPDYRVRIAVMVSLARESRVNPDLQEAFALPTLIRERYSRLSTVADPVERKTRLQGLLMAMGYARIEEWYPTIASHFNDHDREISKTAMHAAGRTAGAFFMDQLIQALGSDVTREAAIEALTYYGSGVIAVLREKLLDTTLASHIRKAFPVIVSRIPSQESVEFCFDALVDEDIELRREAVRGLNQLKEFYPDFRVDRLRTVNEIRKEARLYQDTLSILYAQIQANNQDQPAGAGSSHVAQARQRLIGFLEKKLDADLETIFQLLGLHYASREMLSVYQVLRGQDRDPRADALEFLENLMEPNLKKLLMPIIEVAMWEGISDEVIRKLKIRVPSDYECFKMILQGHSRKLKQAVLFLFRQMRDVRYLPLIEIAARDADPGIREYAAKTRGFI